MVTLGIAFVFLDRNSKARTTELGRHLILPVSLRSEKPCVTPDSLRHLSVPEPVRSAANPSQPRISSSHQLRRRNSPSVTAFSPTRSCIATTSRTQESSIFPKSRLL